MENVNLIEYLLIFYITTLPVIIGGVLNMFVVKSKYNNHLPIDNFYICKDGRRLLGENKTVFGFQSMIIMCMITSVLWGYVCKIDSIGKYNLLYFSNPNIEIFNLEIGFVLGLVYMLFELPNSFIKRRLNITAGKTDKGLKGIIFYIIDQIDSLIGVCLIYKIYTNYRMIDYILFIIIGALTHIVVNLILYGLKVRKNI
jgi:hypothetical protein